jgi:curved DNA-binding protein CbpA
MESRSFPSSFDIARRYAKHREQDYLRYGELGHNDAPNEKEADKGYTNFTQFNSFVNKTFGSGALTDLFNSKTTESKKTSTIEKWYGAFQDQKQQATKSFMNNIKNQDSGTYKWDGNNWVKQ